MLTEKRLYDDSLEGMLNVIADNFNRQGITCEVTSPRTLAFSSPLPKKHVQEILEGSSVPLKIRFEDAQTGCRGSADVQGVPRFDE